jgi:hypothetical protein
MQTDWHLVPQSFVDCTVCPRLKGRHRWDQLWNASPLQHKTWRSTSQFYLGRLLGNPTIRLRIRRHLCSENRRSTYKVRIYWWVLMLLQCLQRFHWKMLIQTLSRKFHRQTVNFMKHVLKTTYFLHVGWFYQQKGGVSVGFPWHR